jgi:hypothetical protein
VRIVLSGKKKEVGWWRRPPSTTRSGILQGAFSGILLQALDIAFSHYAVMFFLLAIFGFVAITLANKGHPFGGPKRAFGAGGFTGMILAELVYLGLFSFRV